MTEWFNLFFGLLQIMVGATMMLLGAGRLKLKNPLGPQWNVALVIIGAIPIVAGLVKCVKAVNGLV